jgi:hypothetical protein
VTELAYIQLAARERDRLALSRALLECAQVIADGSKDGLRAVSLDDLRAALETPLEAYRGYGAEVRADNEADGRIIAWVGCPDCGVMQPVVVTMRVRLTCERDGREIKPTFKCKGRTHVCGQETLPIAPPEWSTPEART